MAHIAVDLEIERLDAGVLQRLNNCWRDLWREERIAAAQDVQHLRLDRPEIGPCVEAEERAAQNDQRMRIPVPRPIGGLLTDRRLALRRIRIGLRQNPLDAVS